MPASYGNRIDSMIEDYIDLHHETIEKADQRALHDVQLILQQNGMSCSHFGLREVEYIDHRAAPELGYDAVEEAEQAVVDIARLNHDQAALVDRVLQDLREI